MYIGRAPPETNRKAWSRVDFPQPFGPVIIITRGTNWHSASRMFLSFLTWNAGIRTISPILVCLGRKSASSAGLELDDGWLGFRRSIQPCCDTKTRPLLAVALRPGSGVVTARIQPVSCLFRTNMADIKPNRWHSLSIALNIAVRFSAR